MSEFGSESFAPGEGVAGAAEQLSEQAKERFSAAAADMKAAQGEEKKSKKRDSRVARAIIKFLADEKYTHLFVLISRLVARDCPSIFILSIICLIDDECRQIVDEYLTESGDITALSVIENSIQISNSTQLSSDANKLLIEWITRMQMVLSRETIQILSKLMIDEKNIDGTVLQLTTFVLQDFFESPLGGERELPFENLHPLTASILQSVFEPFLDSMDKSLLVQPNQQSADDD